LCSPGCGPTTPCGSESCLPDFSCDASNLIDGPAAAGYPILNYEYAIVSTRQPDPAKANAVKAFLNWVITTGNSPTYVRQVNFQPLPSAVAVLASQQIARIG
jgi:phosphate transport system substrate-binding protein